MRYREMTFALVMVVVLGAVLTATLAKALALDGVESSVDLRHQISRPDSGTPEPPRFCCPVVFFL